MNRKEMLIKEVEEKLPKLKEAVQSGGDAIILHQDAFAADYQEEEYRLMGMAIKYIGLHGKEIHTVGNNGETIK